METKHYDPFYEVIVSNVGKVAEGDNAFKANTVYNTYVGQSKRGYGRVAGETVALYRNGELVKEFLGSVQEAEIKENAHDVG